jgi:hypothetical protein
MDRRGPATLVSSAEVGDRDRNQRIDAGSQVEGEASKKETQEGEPQPGPKTHDRGSAPFICQKGFLVDGLGHRARRHDGHGDGQRNISRRQARGSGAGLVGQLASKGLVPEGRILRHHEARLHVDFPGKNSDRFRVIFELLVLGNWEKKILDLYSRLITE